MADAIPSTRARVLLAAVVSVGITFERPPAEESPARAECLSRLVDVLTVVKERLFLLADVIGSTTILEFYGWPPTCSPLVVIALFLLTPRSQPQARNWPAHRYV